MPYFVWHGVDMHGEQKRGRSFARSEQELDEHLFSRNIALLDARQARSWYLRSSMPLPYSIHFFRSLAQLLEAGVLLPDALAIVGDQIDHGHVQKKVYLLADAVYGGNSFSAALKSYAPGFGTMAAEIVQVGQESGRLAVALSAIADYLSAREAVYKRLRSALVMPAITVVFFVVMVVVIIWGIIPSFAHVFSALGKDVPAATQALLAVSAGVQVWHVLAVIAIVGCVVFLGRTVMVTRKARRVRDYLLVRMPYCGHLIEKHAVAHFLHSVSLLVAGGMPLAPALHIARTVVRNTFLHDGLCTLQKRVAAGHALSDAMVQMEHQIFGPDVISLVTVGQESGSLSALLAKAAALYRERVERSLTVMTTLVQPMLLVLLGLLIAVLILIVYVPLFNLAHVI